MIPEEPDGRRANWVRNHWRVWRKAGCLTAIELAAQLVGVHKSGRAPYEASHIGYRIDDLLQGRRAKEKVILMHGLDDVPGCGFEGFVKIGGRVASQNGIVQVPDRKNICPLLACLLNYAVSRMVGENYLEALKRLLSERFKQLPQKLGTSAVHFISWNTYRDLRVRHPCRDPFRPGEIE